MARTQNLGRVATSLDIREAGRNSVLTLMASDKSLETSGMMAIDVTNTARGVICLTCHGAVRLTDFLYVLGKLSNVMHNGNLLIDLADAKLDVTADEIRLIVQRSPAITRIAIVACSAAEYGLARMYEILYDNRGEVAVFTAREEAVQWVSQLPKPTGWD